MGLYCAEKEAFHHAVCSSDAPGACRCHQGDELLPDAYSDEKFLVCSGEEGADPSVRTCTTGKFDNATLSCRAPDDAFRGSAQSCAGPGSFTEKGGDCRSYYTCVDTQEGWVRTDHACANDTHMFNEATQRCEDPCAEGGEEEFQCSEEGRFANPRHPVKYFFCVREGDALVRYQDRCPYGLMWRQVMPTQGLCVEEDQPPADEDPRRGFQFAEHCDVSRCAAGPQGDAAASPDAAPSPVDQPGPAQANLTALPAPAAPLS